VQILVGELAHIFKNELVKKKDYTTATVPRGGFHACRGVALQCVCGGSGASLRKHLRLFLCNRTKNLPISPWKFPELPLLLQLVYCITGSKMGETPLAGTAHPNK
jgi:hypothetical protein